MRAAISRLVESKGFTSLVMAAVLVNAIVLGVDTYVGLPDAMHLWLGRADAAFVTFFVVEMALKLVAWRAGFFKSSWNVFDLSVVAISLASAGPFTVLRVLRALRLVSVAPQMRRVVEALIRAVPGISAIIGVLMVFFYIGAVLATKMFGADHPELFGALEESVITLFQLMLFDGWAGEVVRVVGETHPGSEIFFIAFTVVTGFAILNLFIAVMVDALREEHDRLAEEELEALEEGQKVTAREIDEVEAAVKTLERKIDAMTDKLDAMQATLDTGRERGEL